MCPPAPCLPPDRDRQLPCFIIYVRPDPSSLPSPPSPIQPLSSLLLSRRLRLPSPSLRPFSLQPSPSQSTNRSHCIAKTLFWLPWLVDRSRSIPFSFLLFSLSPFALSSPGSARNPCLSEHPFSIRRYSCRRAVFPVSCRNRLSIRS